MSEYIPDWAKKTLAPITEVKNPNNPLPEQELPDWAKQAIKAQEEQERKAEEKKARQEELRQKYNFAPPKLSKPQIDQLVKNKIAEKLSDIGKIEKYNAEILANYIYNYAEELKSKYFNEMAEIQEIHEAIQADSPVEDIKNTPNFSGSFRRS